MHVVRDLPDDVTDALAVLDEAARLVDYLEEESGLASGRVCMRAASCAQCALPGTAPAERVTDLASLVRKAQRRNNVVKFRR